jgi:hypothetical protein
MVPANVIVDIIKLSPLLFFCETKSFSVQAEIVISAFVASSPELEFVKLNPIAVLLVLQNRYSQSCIAIGFRRCYVQCERKRSNSLNL